MSAPRLAASLRIVLASQSPRRRELLSLIGIAHEVRPANIDESLLAGEEPVPHAERLARGKATVIARAVPDAVTIGADTVVVVDGAILGKPKDARDAARMLRMLSGRTHVVCTAVAVARGPDRLVSGVEQVAVTMRPLSDDEISLYVATREPLDKAGAYGIQGFGSTIVERIDGDFFAVMGLAVGRLVALLRAVGVSYEFGRLTAN
ncbi:MAG: Maf family protein [Gemmatimonadaceae bacterium]